MRYVNPFLYFIVFQITIHFYKYYFIIMKPQIESTLDFSFYLHSKTKQRLVCIETAIKSSFFFAFLGLSQTYFLFRSESALISGTILISSYFMVTDLKYFET